MRIIADILLSSWDVLVQSAPYMLFGFLAAGAVKAFLPVGLAAKHLGRPGLGGVLKASLIGVPLPLCSCGVMPAAAQLRRDGASKGATAAFLISTPETGLDSIAVTYALMGPFMAVLRPVAAFLTATAAGLVIDVMDRPSASAHAAPPAARLMPAGLNAGLKAGLAAAPAFPPGPNPSGACDRPDGQEAKPQTSSCGCGCGSSCGPAPRRGFREKAAYGARYAFGELLGDIGPWFLGGALLAGLIGTFTPQGLLEARFGQGILPMLAMLLLAVPLYVCATASTPIAAALALKGLSPGAALVFLLAGPATNAAAIAVASRILGKKAAALYVGAIMAASLILGILANILFARLGIDVASWTATEHAQDAGLFFDLTAVLLLGLILWNMARAYAPKILNRAA